MNNYHKHSSYSNIYTADSAILNVEYAKRAVELGDKILSSVEHGFQGNYFEVFSLAKEYGLKFIYGAEVYWVRDRFEKDNTNSHMCIFAKTNKGRKAINLAISEANISGYYYRPRLDLDLIMSLPEDDVFITTACLAFWKYDDIEDIVKKLHDKFKDNIMLEVQYHNTDKQKDINKRILKVSKRLGMKIIAGMDSHYIYESQKDDRDQVLLSKNVKYDDEDGWYMDYPSDEQVVERFRRQEVLSEVDIVKAMDNTKIFEQFDDFDDVDIFTKRIKLPTLDAELTQEQRNEKLISIINENWGKVKETIPLDEHEKYRAEIEKEIQTIIDTNMADYFLIDYEIVKEGVKNGGEITPSGRGSGVSNYTNTLLGFSKIDRIGADVKMFPERFMSKTRILETGSIPDLDLNLGNPEVFAEAQRKIFGEHNSYPMIAYGTFKKKSAWKMYAKAKDVDFDVANEISNSLSQYEEDYKYADDDEKDLIRVEDYIPKKYYDIYLKSEEYQGIISDKKGHPCAYLIYDLDIREEIGLLKAVSESTGNETIVCLLDGASSEKFKFLKNDLLKVDVVKLFYAISRKIGKEVPSERELLKLCHGNQKVWDIYKNGFTVGINQVEKEATTKKVMRYQPKTIAELCAFIAAIRPAFTSMYPIFEKRQKFEYGIPTFDKIIQDSGVDSSFILFQEIIMSVLGFAGFSQDKTYDIIKAISKKRKEDIDAIKPQFFKGFKEVIIMNDGMSEEEAQKATDKVWNIIENSSQYGFNSSHSYSYAYDSMLCAYYKSHYPYEFYETLLQEYTNKGNKKKVGLLKTEMREAFGISLSPLRFGYDNRKFTSDKENKQIHQDLSAVKTIGHQVADHLYSLRNQSFTSFTELITASSLNKTQMETLIKIDYFSEFGSSKKLLQVYTKYHKWHNKSTAKKVDLPFPEYIIKLFCEKETEKQFSKVDYKKVIAMWEATLPNEDFSITQKIAWQLEFIGSITYTDPTVDPRLLVVTQLDTKYSPKFIGYSIKTGKSGLIKVRKKPRWDRKEKKLEDADGYEKKPFNEGDLIYGVRFKKEPQLKKDGEKWVKTDVIENWMLKYEIVERA